MEREEEESERSVEEAEEEIANGRSGHEMDVGGEAGGEGGGGGNHEQGGSIKHLSDLDRQVECTPNVGDLAWKALKSHNKFRKCKLQSHIDQPYLQTGLWPREISCARLAAQTPAG